MSPEKRSETFDANDSPVNCCRVCREPIRIQASKCIKCGSYQNWTRHVLRWSALLGSLFVFAQLWSISESLSNLAFSKKSAKLAAAITSCEGDNVQISYENVGDLSAIVTNVEFAVRTKGQRMPLDVSVRSSHDGQDFLVSPGALPVSLVYRAYIDNTETNFISEEQQRQDCTYLIDIHWMDFSGTAQKLQRECRCQ